MRALGPGANTIDKNSLQISLHAGKWSERPVCFRLRRAPPFLSFKNNYLDVAAYLDIVAQCPGVARRWCNGSGARDALEAADMLSFCRLSLWPKYWSPDADGWFGGRDHFRGGFSLIFSFSRTRTKYAGWPRRAEYYSSA